MTNNTNQILFLLHLPPPVHGSSMVGQFVKNSEIINTSFDCRYINLLMSRTIHETGKKGIYKVFRFVRIWFELLKNLIKNKPNLCYFALTATGTAFYKDCLLVLLLRIFRVKRVYHLHNKGVSGNKKHGINAFLYRFVFKNADVILLSKLLYSDVQEFVPYGNLHICPNGVDDVLSSATNWIIPKIKTFKILFLSNLIKSKGVYVLVEACKLLHRRGFWFMCDFIGGEGDITEEQFNIYVRREGLSENVKYLGKKFGQLKEKAYEEADVFVLPTYNECFPLVILEAMQHSLPVISTFEGGIPDMVENRVTGYLVPQKDVEALAGKLETIISDPLLQRQMGIAGRKKYENEFTLDIFEKKLTAILQEVLDKE